MTYELKTVYRHRHGLYYWLVQVVMDSHPIFYLSGYEPSSDRAVEKAKVAKVKQERICILIEERVKKRLIR
jgi:hypothetical protein